MKEYEKILQTNGVTFYQPVETLEETKKTMKRIYDRFNEVFKNKPDLFVKEIKLKKDKQNIFI